MLSILLQSATVAGAGTALLFVRTRMLRREAQTWESLVTRLQPGWNAPASENLAEGATPQERWDHLHGAAGLCTMYQNARVMLEMANYAVRHNASVDPALIAALRSDALHVRVLVVAALTRYAFSHANEGICSHAQRAADMYKEMSVRAAELLRAGVGQAEPQFAGAS